MATADIYTGAGNAPSVSRSAFYVLLADQKKGLHAHSLTDSPTNTHTVSTHVLRHTSAKVSHIHSQRLTLIFTDTIKDAFFFFQRFTYKFMCTHSQLHACRYTHPESNLPNSGHSNDSSQFFHICISHMLLFPFFLEMTQIFI